MKKLKAQLSISRTTSNKGDDCIEISVVDENSHREAVKLKLSMKTFAYAITGQSFLKCEMEFNDSGIIGKTREHKIEKVPLSKPYKYNDKEEAKKAFAPFEVDGWRGSIDDYYNHHNRIGTTHVNVGFVRYVETEEKSHKKKAEPCERLTKALNNLMKYE